MNNKTRRQFLKSTAKASLATAALTMTSTSLLAAEATKPAEKKLSLFNTHTKETIEAVYWRDGKYDEDVMTQLYLLLRDHRENEAAVIDCRLFDQLWDLQQRCGGEGTFEIISGYRSPTTNGKLRKGSSGVAKKSYHMKGRAIDIRLRGTHLSKLRRAALAMRAGGVGYYPSSDFIHLDTGPVRSWS